MQEEKDETEYVKYSKRHLILEALNPCSVRSKRTNAPNLLIGFSPFDKTLLELFANF
jgi:hypothetical protein